MASCKGESVLLKQIQAFFEKHFKADDVESVTIEQQLNIAAAALLVEMIVQDEHIKPEEVSQVKAVITTEFKLSKTQTDELYLLAEEESSQATDYYQFTKLITEHYTQAQKIKLIESLWRVAFADNVLDKYEENLVRKISDLIHVSHKDFILAKHRVENK